MISPDKCQMCIHQDICVDLEMASDKDQFKEDIAMYGCDTFKPFCEYCKHYLEASGINLCHQVQGTYAIKCVEPKSFCSEGEI